MLNRQDLLPTMVEGQARLAKTFKALGDETRLRLIAELARRGEVTCGEFAMLCACSNSALTYHQRVLSEAGLIKVRRVGQYRLLSLRRESFESLLPGFLERLASAPAAR
jgi:ArsR family transcriptional regulator, lead/cadmium/zinc/bismuth-responsive transcriptional repressor